MKITVKFSPPPICSRHSFGQAYCREVAISLISKSERFRHASFVPAGYCTCAPVRCGNRIKVHIIDCKATASDPLDPNSILCLPKLVKSFKDGFYRSGVETAWAESCHSTVNNAARTFVNYFLIHYFYPLPCDFSKEFLIFLSRGRGQELSLRRIKQCQLQHGHVLHSLHLWQTALVWTSLRREQP